MQFGFYCSYISNFSCIYNLRMFGCTAIRKKIECKSKYQIQTVKMNQKCLNLNIEKKNQIHVVSFQNFEHSSQNIDFVCFHGYLITCLLQCLLKSKINLHMHFVLGITIKIICSGPVFEF